MNPIIIQHFEEIEIRLIQSPVIVSYQIVRREIAPIDGKLRIKMALSDGGLAEFVEYITESGGNILLSKYSFHWQDASGKLKRRWDNAPHHPELPNSPHHVHHEDRTIHGVITVPDIFYVIEQIEKGLDTA